MYVYYMITGLFWGDLFMKRKCTLFSPTVGHEINLVDLDGY